jgi:hypothetical protein
MMLMNHVMSELKPTPAQALAVMPQPPSRKLVAPPALQLLPRGACTRGMFFSSVLHTALLSAATWLPSFFPHAVVIEPRAPDQSELASSEQLIFPALPKLNIAGADAESPASEQRTSVRTRTAANQPQLKRDYAGPQEIVSLFPDAVNRVQTIRRPDLPSPPDLKFPIRLESMVSIPAPAVPVLAPRPPEPALPKPPLPPDPVIDGIPVAKATVPTPILVSKPKKIFIPAETPAPPVAKVQAEPSDITFLTSTQSSAIKSVVVVNAVNVPADPSARIPDAQLAGNFVVGPMPASPGQGPDVVERSSGTANARSSERGAPASHPAAEAGSGSGPKTPGPIRDTAATAGTGRGTASGSGPGSGNVAAAIGSGSGTSPGISISGGVPDRNGSINTRALPMRPSYGLTIISGGNNGGASRDVGFFDRGETVFSVVIPMADAGGGPDWPMQYSLADRTQSSAGFIVPPFVRKKIAPIIKKNENFQADSGPVLVAGIIDESGKVKSLRALRPQDTRAQPAIVALQQWEFLPAQLDGRAVATRILIGVTVITEMTEK